ncbi:MAG: DUF4407 domain-containing protein [Bacteroidota bacterium]
MTDIFLILSGDDRSIIRQCSKKTQNIFIIIGALVSCIIVLSFISVTGAFIHFFDYILIDIAIGLFFALMMANIYLLLLYTLSKNLLPHISSKGTRNISVGLRVAFIAIFAIIVSKPLELFLFSPLIEKEIILHKQNEYKSGELVINSIYDKSFKDLERLKQLGDSSASQILTSKKIEKIENLSDLQLKIESSDFYLQQLRILNSKYLFTWIFTLMIILLFLSPIYVKFLMKEENEFYQKKKSIEIQIVLDEYTSFKTRYKIFWKEFFQDLEKRPPDKNARINVVLSEIIQKNYEFEVVYADPPFNTVKSEDQRNILDQFSLKEELYNV